MISLCPVIRSVAIGGAVLDILHELRDKAKEPRDGEVFTTSRGGLLRDNSIRTNFNAAFKKAKLPWSGTHIARHTFATLALISERDLGAVQAALGHRSQRQTEVYAKVVALRSPALSRSVQALIGIADGRTVLAVVGDRSGNGLG